MVIFKKKPKGLEPELAALRQRAEALDAKRQEAEAELTAATEARQRHLIEGDIDDAKTAQALQDRVNAAASQVVGLEDALAAVGAQIAEIEQKLGAAAAQAERHAAAEKLARDLDVIQKALPLYLDAARRLTDAIEAVGFWHYEIGEVGVFLRSSKPQIETQATFGLQELRAMVEQIKTGVAPIPPAKPAEPEPVVVEPAPETRRLFCLQSVKWRNEKGKLQVADQYTDVDLPQHLVGRALRKGACVSIDDERRKQNLGAHGGRHPNPDYAVDLDAIGDNSGAHFAGPENDPVLRAANFQQVDRGEPRLISIAAGRAG
jgi:hypothetical protein